MRIYIHIYIYIPCSNPNDGIRLKDISSESESGNKFIMAFISSISIVDGRGESAKKSLKFFVNNYFLEEYYSNFYNITKKKIVSITYYKKNDYDSSVIYLKFKYRSYLRHISEVKYLK